jgi:hypothetical protein
MLGHNLPIERLRDYLLTLKPEALSLLVTELERGLLRGDDMPGAELVLNELRRTLRETGQRVPRVGNPARLFYRPLEPFLVDDVPERRHRARVARKVLTPVWQWLCTFAMKAEADAYIACVEQALIAGDDAAAAQHAREFQNLAGPRMLALMEQVKGDDRARRRLMLQIGTPHALDDVRCIAEVLMARDRLAAIGAQLPAHIKTLSGPALDGAKAVLDAALVRQRDIFSYALVVVMSRMAAPWQLIRLATLAAGSDAAARIAETPYALCVDIVFTEIERMVSELTAELQSGRGVAVSAQLKDVHDAMRGFRTEIDLSADVPWAGRHAAILTQISEALSPVIELIPGRVRRLLRPTSSAAPGARLDAGEVAETEALVGFVTTCRRYASELAVNEVTLRAFSDLQHLLDSGTHALLDALRAAGPAEREFRQSQVDAAVRFCAQFFGKEYAALLAKAAEVAGQDPERKAAKA